jgi:hypothetical protein
VRQIKVKSYSLEQIEGFVFMLSCRLNQRYWLYLKVCTRLSSFDIFDKVHTSLCLLQILRYQCKTMNPEELFLQ